MTVDKKKAADGVGGQKNANQNEGRTMAEIAPKGNPIAVSTNKLERHHWRMGLAACSQISSSAFRLAVVIEDYMNDRSGEAWPEQETLSMRAAISSRQVREHLTALVSAGWLKVLSGKDRTRPKTRRGLHYRPMWPDEATKDRCLSREYATTMEPINTGGNPPVLNQNETGNLASQKRKSGASIPAEKRRNTGENPPLSYEATYEVTYTGRGSSRVPEVLDNSSISGGAAFADASGSLTGGEMDHSLGDVGEPPAWIEEIPPPASPDDYLAGAEAFEAPCKNSDDPSVAGHDYQSAHDEAERQSFADEDDEFADDDDCEGRIPYDDPSSDEGGTDLGDASSDSQAEPIAAVVEDRATFVTQKHHRWPDEFDPDAVYDEGGEPIRNDDADETDVDFEDDADEETHEGARI